jgi:hypothetical protein
VRGFSPKERSYIERRRDIPNVTGDSPWRGRCPRAVREIHADIDRLLASRGRRGAQAAFVPPSRLTSLAGKERSHRPLPWNTSSLINVSFSLTSFPSLRRMVGKARNRRCRIGAFLAAFPAALLMLILPRSTNRRRGAEIRNIGEPEHRILR